MLNKIVLGLLVFVLIAVVYMRIDMFGVIDAPECSRPLQYLPIGIRCIGPGKGMRVETFCSERHKELGLCE